MVRRGRRSELAVTSLLDRGHLATARKVPRRGVVGGSGWHGRVGCTTTHRLWRSSGCREGHLTGPMHPAGASVFNGSHCFVRAAGALQRPRDAGDSRRVARG